MLSTLSFPAVFFLVGALSAGFLLPAPAVSAGPFFEPSIGKSPIASTRVQVNPLILADPRLSVAHDGIQSAETAGHGLPVANCAENIAAVAIPDKTKASSEGAGSLLRGMTPTNYRLPGGWSLIRTQNFEGSCPDGEWCGLRQGSVTTTRPHSGSRSVEGRYRRDQDEVGWALIGATGDFRELYLSWWEYTESTVRWNDEKFVTHFIKRLPNDQFQEVIVDFMWSGSFNSTTAIWRVEPQGYALTTNLGLDRQVTYPTDRWVQFEVWYKPNRAGSTDGFLRLYQDGVPIDLGDTVENANINGVESMSNCDVTVGGLYTKNIWMMDHPACTACSKGPGEGTDYCKSAMGWDGFPFANPPACGNPVPEFSQYFDDIIIMKK